MLPQTIIWKHTSSAVPETRSANQPAAKAHIADDHIESSGLGFPEIPMVDPSHTKHPTLLEDTKPNRDKIGIGIPKIGYKNAYS